MEEKIFGYCLCCREKTYLRKKGVNYISLIFFSVLTMGAWFFLWFFYIRKRYVCNECGNIAKKDTVSVEDYNYDRDDMIFNVVIILYFIIFLVLTVWQLCC